MVQLTGMTGEDQPRVRDAVIGAAFGVLLIWLGTLAASRLVSWPLIGCGLLFVIVMSAFVLVTFWETASPTIRRVLARARGHVRQDPQLGKLTRNVKDQFWEANVTTRTGRVDVMIEGTGEPAPVLLARGREIVATFDVLEARVSEYIAREATIEAKEDPEWAAQIRALRVSAIRLESIDRPNDAVIEFKGQDEDIYWYCDYVDGELSGLSFDS